jgi:outer membrane protein TolC
MTMKEISLSQKFPFPGKRPLLKEAAEKEAEAASAEVEEMNNRVIKEVKTAYFDLSHVHRASAVTKKNKEILENFVKIAETRYKLGRGLQQDLLKAHLEVSKMVDELIMLDQQKLAFEAKLAGLLNRPPGAPMGQPDEVEFRKLPIVLEDLQQAAIEANPTLKGLKKMIESKQTGHKLAGMAYYPDFNVRLSYGQRDDAPDMYRRDLLTAMVEVNLPIFSGSKQDRKVLETAAEIQTAEAQFHAAKNEILYMTASMASMVQREERKLELYRTGIIPQATLQTHSALSAYTVNSVDFLTLLDSQMTLYRYELEYHRALTEYEKNLANLEWVVGKRLF